GVAGPSRRDGGRGSGTGPEAPRPARPSIPAHRGARAGACGAHATVRSSVIAESSSGLYCEAGGFHIDPWLPVERAIVTHAHSDHASPGSRRYLCAEPARPVMERRLPAAAIETLPYGWSTRIGDVTVSFNPAGHILGSAQVRVEHRGEVWVVSGAYKLQADPPCAPFEPVRCHGFWTKCT